MIDTFVDVRDLHTNHILPSPYATKSAFLTFLLEAFFEGGKLRSNHRRESMHLERNQWQPI
jgi:hypothetical protein